MPASDNLNTSQFGREGGFYTHRQMINAGADGHLTRGARLQHIPVADIDGREPVPSMEGSHVGKKITQPVEVHHEDGKYMLYAGNHRVRQAEINGQTHIPAFVAKRL